MTYTLKQWEEEMEIARLSYHAPYGSCRLPCPNCRVIGFYSPRDDGRGRKYRACKFCGFWQNVDEEPFRCEAVLCSDCGVFDWHENFVGQACNNCKSTNKTKCPWAIDCLSHPFWQMKQEFEKCIVHKQDQNKFMEDKKQHCESKIERWKELRAKLPKAQDPKKPIEPSHITPDEIEELDKITEELKKDCLGHLSLEDQWEVENN